MTKSDLNVKITKLQVEALVKFDVTKNKIESFRYERKIKKSQKRIGQYVAPTCKTIYA